MPVGWADNYGDYLSLTVHELQALAPDEWSPAMDELDLILSSLYVTGDFGDGDGN